MAVEETVSEGRPTKVVRGEDVHTEIEIHRSEAAEGTDELVNYDVLVRCRECLGRGSVSLPGPACEYCGGTGTVSAARRIRLLVPPGAEDGTQLRVRGEGDDAGAGSLPGDLLVRVRVLTPDDPRIVRYSAFVLMILAVATLVLYLVARESKDLVGSALVTCLGRAISLLAGHG
jgi:DnaJ-class molecular chaperone